MTRVPIDRNHYNASDNLSEFGRNISANAIVAEALSEFGEIASRLMDKKTSIESRFGGSELARVRARPEVIALQIIQARATTDSLFHGLAMSDGHHLDILLDLFVNEAIDRNVAVSDACIASRSPATTALRWLGLLQERGLIQKRNDPSDQRRWFVSLTPEGRSRTLKCIEAFSSIAGTDVE